MIMKLSVVKDLAPLKAQAEVEINRRATAWRNKYITPGKDGIYLSKREEAIRWLAAGEPTDLTSYPWLAGETGITAYPTYALAQLWLNLNELWLTTIGPGIEAAEQGAKLALRNATNPAEIAAAVERLPLG